MTGAQIDQLQTILVAAAILFACLIIYKNSSIRKSEGP